MRVARIDYYQKGRPVERGNELPRHEVSLESEVEYFKRYERIERVEILPASFPILGRAILRLENEPPLVLVMRDCGSY